MKKFAVVVMVICGVVMMSTLCLASQIWRMDADGQELKQITPGGTDINRCWIYSSNGKNLIVGGEGQIDFLNLDGKVIKHYTENKDFDYYPIVSTKGGVCVAVQSKGKLIKFILFDEASWKKKHEINFNCEPGFAVSNNLLMAYAVKTDDIYNGYIYNFATGKKISLGEVGRNYRFVWTKDGKYLAFPNPNSMGITVVNQNGQVSYTDQNKSTCPVAWSGDNKYLMVNMYTKIQIRETTTWKTVNTIDVVLTGGGEWAPDHKSFVFFGDRIEKGEVVKALFKGDLRGSIGELVEFGEDRLTDIRWTPDGKYMYFSRILKRGSDEGYDFGKIRMGMTKKEVMQSEGGPVSQDTDVLLFTVSVDGLDAQLYCAFNEKGQLYQIMYSFMEKASGNLSISDYEHVKSLLKICYGKPAIDTMQWKRNEYKDNPKYYDLAVSKGDLHLGCIWDFPDIIISLNMGVTSSTYITINSYSEEYDLNEK